MSGNIGGSFVPLPVPGVESAVLNGERLLWQGGYLRRLDRVASVVWPCFDGQSTVAELAPDLAGAFGTSPSRVEADVLELCESLVAGGFLGGANAGAARPHRSPSGRTPRDGPLVGPGALPQHARRLDGLSWACETPRFLALEHDFAIRSTDASLGPYFERALGSFATDGTPARRYSVVDTMVPGPARYETYLDDLGLRVAADADVVVRHVLWHINQEALRLADRHLLVHAAGAVCGDRAVVLAGPMNAGKSTLVAGLVLDGFGYLTDEMVAFDLASGQIDPYPRPLNLGRGSHRVLPQLQPPDWNPDDPLPRDLWHVDARAIRPGAIAGPARLGFVVLPQFTLGAAPSLEPISPAEAVEELHSHALNALRHGAAGFRMLVAVVAHAGCARLVTGSLEPAVDLIRRFVADDSGTRSHAE